jgi:hypothetical protein
MSRAVLIQQASGRHVPMLHLTARRHAEYCARHHLTYWALAGDVQFTRSPHWNKIVLIQEALRQGFELVTWLDADTLIVRDTEDIRTALTGRAPLAMAIHRSPGLNGPKDHYNSGVMVLRNTFETREFFDAVWHEGPLRNHHWNEQARILDLLAKSPALVQVLDPCWNATQGLAPVEDPIIKAWHGAGPAALTGICHELRQLGTPDPQVLAVADSIVHRGNASQRASEFIQTIPPDAPNFEGRGIVICAGGIGYFTCAWICIHQLRRLGCRLPIQMWHLGRRELNDHMRSLVAPLRVECVDAIATGLRPPRDGLIAWELKPHAMLHSPFRQVLLLDSDNVPVLNPEFLFDTPEFARTGAVFWPDRGRMSAAHPAWEMFDVPFRDEPEFESGQMLVDKEKCWRALRLAMWYNEHSDFFYQHVYGDKDTFRFAWHRLGLRFSMPSTPLREIEHTFLQHDFDGRVVFQHRAEDKWNFFRDNKSVDGFRFEKECLDDLRRLRSLWDGRIGVLR